MLQNKFNNVQLENYSELFIVWVMIFLQYPTKTLFMLLIVLNKEDVVYF